MTNELTPGKIREIRELSALSREDFGRIFSVTRMTVSRWERGQAMPEEFRRAALIRYGERLRAQRREEKREETTNNLLAAAVLLGAAGVADYLFGNSNSDEGEDDE